MSLTVNYLHDEVTRLTEENSRLRGVLETAVQELDGWRDNGSDVMRDELVDDFIVAARDALASTREDRR